ncbi:helix-turn-helix transcriptional regulator [Yinghuangia seranimata]|uniref:helix-turn-helix transcriptional regulator n=1 Tax=Yinghuangia seranimata TaxID=408067 RepID=UPI00248BE6AB|nr:AAA family ATPase [Yinghuangia seranimata]MDI2129352.1 AAA family ATPase [Yinghuangia seranimata]
MTLPHGMLDPVSTLAVSPVFVGRLPELSRLAEAKREADAGVPGVLLIGGEAGVGKTRLLQEFLDQADADGAVVALGGCLELGAEGLPFAPVSAAMRVLGDVLGDELEAAVAGREQDLSWVMPHLNASHARDTSGDYDRARLFELMLRVLERLGGQRTLIVALEDLHWADASTRELLSFLVRSLRRGRILVIGTYRADAIDRRHPMRAFLAELDRTRTVRRLELGRLTRAQVGEQLRGILGEEQPRRLIRQIHQKSEGNAFFVEELACSVRCGRLDGLSDTLRDLLLIRVEELPDDTQRVVRLAAVGGPTVGHRLLAEVTGLGPSELDDALRSAVSRHVLIPNRAGDGYCFRHALVREAVRDDLLPGERMRKYARYAEVLDRWPDLVPSDEYASRLAMYWYHAGRATEALPAVLAAAEAARVRYAFGEQFRLLERALELWEQVADPEELTGITLLDLLIAAIMPARFDNAFDKALAFTRQALDLIDPQQDPRLAAHLWTSRANLLRMSNRAGGLAELRKAEALLVDLPPSIEHARVLGQIARDQMLDDPTEQSVATARDALAIARQVGSRADEATILKTLANLQISLGHIEAGLATFDEACAIAEKVAEPDVMCLVLSNLSSIYEGLGRHADAVDAARRSLDIAREYRLVRGFGAFSIGNLAESLISLGEWDEAEALLDELFEHDPKPETLGHAHRLNVEVALARGDIARAVRCLDQARVISGASFVEPQFRIPVRTLEVAVARRLGKLPEVRELIRAELNAGFPAGAQRYAWPLLVEAARAEGDVTELAGYPRGGAELKARQDALKRIRTAALALARDCALDEAHAVNLRAELARAEGEATVDLWEQAVAAWEENSQPYILARVRSRLATALIAAGDRQRAADVLSAAHTAAAALGARPLTEETELLARRARLPLDGTPTTPGPRDPLAPDPADGPMLTPRERDVLRLVVDGRSNRQIAEELFISVKTASVHVSNILGKLEVSSRGEAAALAHRLQLVDSA